MNNNPLEKFIEGKVCLYAADKGWLTYKFTSPNRSAVPDRLFITPFGRVIFVEFKRKGMKPTPAQSREHDRLTRQGCTVRVIDCVSDGIDLIDADWGM